MAVDTKFLWIFMKDKKKCIKKKKKDVLESLGTSTNEELSIHMRFAANLQTGVDVSKLLPKLYGGLISIALVRVPPIYS